MKFRGDGSADGDGGGGGVCVCVCVCVSVFVCVFCCVVLCMPSTKCVPGASKKSLVSKNLTCLYFFESGFQMSVKNRTQYF